MSSGTDIYLVLWGLGMLILILWQLPKRLEEEEQRWIETIESWKKKPLDKDKNV